ncbi:MAG: histone acetyltransferases subunit 3-domain-containing protein [Piptocephalis tieghemiana]|nr:MAG: histone acetyltransferases subunit 3-domain-containing protein [Piptocephalis tieghemiana]
MKPPEPANPLSPYGKEAKPRFLRLLPRSFTRRREEGDEEPLNVPSTQSLRALRRELEFIDSRLSTRLVRLAHDRKALADRRTEWQTAAAATSSQEDSSRSTKRSASPAPTSKYKISRTEPSPLSSSSSSSGPFPSTPFKVKTSHPATDIPYDDPKPRNQIPIIQFWNTVDPHFRPLTENDLAFLEQPPIPPSPSTVTTTTTSSSSSKQPPGSQASGEKEDHEGKEGSGPSQDDTGPFIIPPLGRHYSAIWTQEDSHRSSSSSSSSPSISSSSSSQDSGGLKALYTSVNRAMAPSDLTDEHLLSPNPTAGPLTSRLVAALMRDVGSHRVWGTDPHIRAKAHKQTFDTLEGRVERELARIGLVPEGTVVDWSAKEDDPLCAELRQLQEELAIVKEKNDRHKRLLIPRVRDRIAYQQYLSIRDDLDKEVYEHGVKRPGSKGKKKKGPGSSSSSSSSSSSVIFLPEAAVPSMRRRKAFIQALGPIFDDPKFTDPPSELFHDEHQDPSPHPSASLNDHPPEEIHHPPPPPK